MLHGGMIKPYTVKMTKKIIYVRIVLKMKFNARVIQHQIETSGMRVHRTWRVKGSMTWHS